MVVVVEFLNKKQNFHRNNEKVVLIELQKRKRKRSWIIFLLVAIDLQSRFRLSSLFICLFKN